MDEEDDARHIVEAYKRYKQKGRTKAEFLFGISLAIDILERRISKKQASMLMRAFAETSDTR